MKILTIFSLTSILVGLASSFPTALANELVQIRPSRWLEVRHLLGQVMYSHQGKSQLARNGTRLTTVGDAIDTKQNSSAVLAVDIGTGWINLAESTSVNIEKLSTGKDGERVTELQVKSGQIRLQLRKFTHTASRLEIHTPAGIAGVRGTTFGVNVQHDGKMSVATLKGGVATSAQGQTIMVKAGFQNTTIPGEPPSTPVPLTENTRLDIRQLAASAGQVRIIGSIDPVNLLLIANRSQNTDSNGRFDITVPLVANHRIQAIVVTPLGKKQIYQLAIP